MGLLDKLWDDVVAGPAPDKGLGKLRRSHTFSYSSSSSSSSSSSNGHEMDPEISITRSITILRKSPSHNDDGVSSEGSTPRSSASTFSSPNSPMTSSHLTCSPLGSWRRTQLMKKQRNVPDKSESVEPMQRTPMGSEPYDWVIMSALDR